MMYKEWTVVFVFALFLIYCGLYIRLAHGEPVSRAYLSAPDFIFCHEVGVKDLSQVPPTAKILLSRLIGSSKSGDKPEKLERLPIYLNGVQGLHATPYTGFKIVPTPEEGWECYLLVHDE
jgi:hypothetical protein